LGRSTLILLGHILQSRSALIVYRLEEFEKPSEHLIHFRNGAFISTLANSSSSDLGQFISREDIKIVLELIAETRNTIHREKLDILDFKNKSTHKQTPLIPVPKTHNYNKPELKTLWDICQTIKLSEEWGIIQNGKELLIEPYSFSYTLLERGFEIIGEVARKTNFSALSLTVDQEELNRIPKRLEKSLEPPEKLLDLFF
jgi:hypothetical protein